MKLRSIDYSSVKGTKVLVRVDFNVPLKDGVVTDDSRIMAYKETVQLLQKAGAKVALISHLGRPKGHVVPELSLINILGSVRKILGNVEFIPACTGNLVSEAMDKLSDGDLVLLENSRFYPEESENDEHFSRSIAEPFDAFVLDAFSVSHRGHATTLGVQSYLPSYAGELLKKEIESLSMVRDKAKVPFVLILGGAKVKDKIAVIKNLMPKLSSILICGGMAFTFLKAAGYEIGRSLLDESHLEFAGVMLKKAREMGVNVLLPEDIVVSSSIEDEDSSSVVDVSSIPENMMGLDIGPDTVEQFSNVLDGARTILWNGPAGVFEVPAFSTGTKGLCQAVIKSTSKGAFSVVGGGDTAAAAKILGFSDGFSHVSTGGGASLEFCEGKILPALKPLIL